MSAPQPMQAWAIPVGLDPWLDSFLRSEIAITVMLRDNGAESAAAARDALLCRLLTAAETWLNTEVGVADAARLVGKSEETIRRAFRRGDLPDERSNGRGKHRARRRDVLALERRTDGAYDPIADAQDIAKLRRSG